MQYLGGKSRIAKHLAPVVNALRTAERPYFWEPFCGGLSMSVQLAAHGPGVVSDANLALIALYQGVRRGWDPPAVLSETEYRAARALPDLVPTKAFAGFGCSFGGKWFSGYARATRLSHDYAGASRRSLMRDVPKIANCALACIDFLVETPRPLPLVIYADPPYAGTTGYAATGASFDHDLFWQRCGEWERCGVPVLVSEYACPVPHEVLWERTYSRSLRRAGERDHTDKLFRVLP